MLQAGAAVVLVCALLCVVHGQNCPDGQWGVGLIDACQNCPSCSSALAGTNNTTPLSCTCLPGCGYDSINALSNPCPPCTAGTYQSNSYTTNTCQSCSPPADSPAGASNCSCCVAGYGLSGGVCMPCMQGYTSTRCGTGCLACPLNCGNAANGTVGCNALPGFVGTCTGSAATACAVGSYRSGYGSAEDVTCSDCPIYQTTVLPGSSSLSMCVAAPGAGWNGVNATKCIKGTWKSETANIGCHDCGLGMYTVNLGSTSIADCTLCNVTYYNDKPNGTCTRCSAGYTSDQGSISASQCRPCGYNMYRRNGDNNCNPCPGSNTNTTTNAATMMGDCQCRAGTGGGQPCNQCTLGYFKNYTGNAACTRCPEGWSSLPPFTSCFPCEVGNFSVDPGGGLPMVCTKCETYKTTFGVGSTACHCDKGREVNGTSCEACQVGMYKDVVGDVACVPCPSGSTTLTLQGDSISSCFLCKPNYYNLTAQFTCSLCPNCGDKLCVEGAQGNGACTCSNTTGYSGPLCNVCNHPRFFGPNCDQECICANGLCRAGPTGDGLCSLCFIGYAPPLCSACRDGFSDATFCTACSPGYQFVTPDVNTTLCVGCQPGQYKGGTSNTNGCNDCQIGTAAPANVSAYCPECQPGTAMDHTGAAMCNICQPGQITNVSHAIVCTACPFGFQQPRPGRDHCDACAPGSYSNDTDGAANCTLCPAGWHQPANQSSECVQCDIGTWSGTPGFPICDACPIGAYCPTIGVSVHSNCSAGYSTAGTGSSLPSQCGACPLNTYKDGNASPCIDCPSTWTTQQTASVSLADCGCIPGLGLDGYNLCSNCQPGYVQTTFGQHQCLVCDPTFYFVSPSLACAPCPIGGICTGADAEPYAAEGFWRDTSQPGFVFLQCPPGVCYLYGVCREGHTGPRCTLCQEGYYKDDNTSFCYSCPPVVPLIMFSLFVLALVACIVLVRLARKPSLLVSIGVGLNFMQVVSILPSFNLQWPAFVTRVYALLSFVTFNVQIFRPACMVKAGAGNPYYYVWALKAGTPFFFAVMLGSYVLFVKIYSSCRGRCRFARNSCASKMFPFYTEREVSVIASSSLNAFCSILVFLYLLLGINALEIYPCTQTLDGRLYTMNREPYVICYEDSWNRLMGFSVASMLIYSLGIPVAIFYLLYTRRHNIFKEKNALRFGLLFLRYKDQYYLYEIAILIRKFGIVSGKILFSSNQMLQAVTACTFCVVGLAFQLYIRPYRTWRLNVLETMQLAASAIVLGLGIIFVSVKLPDGVDTTLGIVCIGLIGSVILGVIACLIFEAWVLRRMGGHGLGGRSAGDRMEVFETFYDINSCLLGYDQAQYNANGLEKVVARFEQRTQLNKFSSIFTMRMTTTTPVRILAQMHLVKIFRFKEDKKYEAEGAEHESMWKELLRCGNLKSERGLPVMQIVESTPDGCSHTVTMLAPLSGRYLGAIFAQPLPDPVSGLAPTLGAQPIGCKSKCSRKMSPRVYAPVEDMRELHDDVMTFVRQGGARLINFHLSCSREWDAQDTTAGFTVDQNWEDRQSRDVQNLRSMAISMIQTGSALDSFAYPDPSTPAPGQHPDSWHAGANVNPVFDVDNLGVRRGGSFSSR